jgi:hypothetical protein
MKRYRIDAIATISLTTYVTAESREEAIENCDAEMPRLCNECSSNDGDGQWSLSGEIDGEPQIQSAELI